LKGRDVKRPSIRQSTSGRQKHEEATIDHLAEKVYEEKPKGGAVQSSTTESGMPVEEQVRKEWDPKKEGGLPTF
jgi:hypothetical protein